MHFRPWLPACLALFLIAPGQAQTPSPVDLLDAPPAGIDAPPPASPLEGELPLAPSVEHDVVSGDQVSLDEIRRFVAVFRAVKQAYVDPVDDATLMRAAIRGLLTDLDPHSAYLDDEQSQSLSELTNGAYDGLGLEVIQQPDRSLLVIAPIDGTPAARAGIRPGDLIIAIDGLTINADNVDAAVESMRGEPGTSTELTILREAQAGPLTLQLVRETIRVASVRARALEAGYGYLRISQFQADTGREVARKVKELSSAQPLRGLVLDLRSNPGGLLHTAIEAAGVFLDGGVVVSTRGRLPFSVSESRASPGDLLNGAPIVVLIDEGTASAAEVLAAALRDRRRALLMGSQSFGKGSVQTVLPLDNGDAVKLTTARYYTPDGRSIQASGIVPDIALPDGATLQLGVNRPPSLRERDLPGHLRSTEEEAAAAPRDAGIATATEANPTTSPNPPPDDFAISQALTVLKGLALFAPATSTPQPVAKGDPS